MPALAIAVAVRLTASVSPAWRAPTPVSNQHIRAAPGDTHTSRNAPASAGQAPGVTIGMMSTSGTATTLAAIPT